MIIDGKAIATGVLARAKARAEALGRTPRVVAITGADTATTRSYLKLKESRAIDAGCVFETRSFGTDAADADAVIVQLPLAEGANTQEVLNSISIEKDADVLSVAARMAFETGADGALVPPVAGAVGEILVWGKVNPEGKKAVVIGNGWLVGQPCTTLLRHLGVEVEVITLDSGELSTLKTADIIISGAGVPHLIKPEMLKEGAVLIDAGTSESSGKIVGDADPACAPLCSIFTPVPGGVGPIAVAKLFENAVTLAERRLG